ncbi:hypothetical protein ETD86_44150 [Nonomuraea turkmeniaca]|uniref:Core-binding (CB) domain-containing protein n=1 Tax=Nonomuraea turkmeniaca TaxID=103838 RepID=A0A5S4F070_9ACTN|nr:phage integrase N-terminal SAM-like domain-containing protein [Nonomuraea turkmeniaca]TMR09300.1 hypothetical protein ETD86_44150 [Nonomuraea turkmeniaca]
MDQHNLLTWRDFERDLKLANRSPRTIQSYEEAVLQLLEFHTDGGAPEPDLADLTKTEISDYLLHVKEQHSASTAGNRFRSLRRLYNWMAREEIIDKSPMASISEPKGEDKPIPIPAIDDVRALLDTCRGTRYATRRSSGCSASREHHESPRWPACSLSASTSPQDVVVILGKGKKWRSVPFGAKTGKALTRYLRARAKHPLARLEACGSAPAANNSPPRASIR